MAGDLWERIGACFNTDDGSLPSIEVAELSPPGGAAVFAMLRARARFVCDVPEFWDIAAEASRPVASVPNAAQLVASGQAEAFHLVLGGIEAGGVELPHLGVFVCPVAIELDYRMGPDWGPMQVAGFFELLGDCCTLGPGVTVTPGSDGPPHPERFAEA